MPDEQQTYKLVIKDGSYSEEVNLKEPPKMVKRTHSKIEHEFQ